MVRSDIKQQVRSTERSSQSKWSSKSTKILVVAIVIVGLGGALIFHLAQNPAADIVKSLGSELVANGAVSECGSGDPGFGPDNYAPWYGMSYTLPVDKAQAIALMYRVAADKGYSLTHASPNNRGHLGGVADIYIDKWYFDDSKPTSALYLKPGNIKLAFSVDGPGSKDSCKQTTIQPGHSVIGIGVQLPDRKF